ncbi:MAG TPA: hypothetical protein VHK90_07060, partial [Thermoanaerobaculia bacterium]|nr:hypothetical protein [Thermoanaerobaculia bacterium]
ELQVFQPVQGWVAISEFNIAFGRNLGPEIRDWVDALLADKPYRRVGKTIRLYYFSSPQPAPAPATAPPAHPPRR